MKKHPETSPEDASGGGARDEGGAGAFAPLEERVRELEAALEEANSRALRTLADFQNYKKRSLVEERLAREEGIASVAGGVTSVLDHFDLALNVDADRASAASVIDGVRLIQSELLKTLGEHGVERVEAQPGDEFDPHVHQAVGQAPVRGVAPGRVAQTVKPGYRLGQRTLRPAMVLVAPRREGHDARDVGLRGGVHDVDDESGEGL